MFKRILFEILINIVTLGLKGLKEKQAENDK